MNLVMNSVYRMNENHAQYPGRVGKFKGIIGNNNDLLLFTDVENEERIFTVDALSVQGFNPLTDMVL